MQPVSQESDRITESGSEYVSPGNSSQLDHSTYSVDKKETFVDEDSSFVPHSHNQSDEADVSTES
jgi:hypothetical protein